MTPSDIANHCLHNLPAARIHNKKPIDAMAAPGAMQAQYYAGAPGVVDLHLPGSTEADIEVRSGCGRTAGRIRPLKHVQQSGKQTVPRCCR